MKSAEGAISGWQRPKATIPRSRPLWDELPKKFAHSELIRK
jgi:hypothetical protein